MILKGMVALLLTLAIQWLAVGPCMAAGDDKTLCADTSCCEGSSCPCIAQGEPDQAPNPIAPAPLSPKPVAFFESDHDGPDLSSKSFALAECITVNTPAGESFHGYIGVSLSVAFCRFVI